MWLSLSKKPLASLATVKLQLFYSADKVWQLHLAWEEMNHAEINELEKQKQKMSEWEKI